MRIIEFIVGRAPHIDAPAPDLPANVIAKDQPDIELIDEEEAGGDAKFFDLDPVYTIMDYTDAAGNETRRRITMRRLARGPQAPILTAVCHERRAVRYFRWDRISGFIDDDGEVLEAGEFLSKTFGLTLASLELEAVDASERNDARRIRDILRPALSILAAAARSDDEFHPDELDAIECYVEKELPFLIKKGLYQGGQTVQVLDQLRPMIRKMRPSADALPNYFGAILTHSHDRFQRFMSALHVVIQADGLVTQDELEIVEWLSQLEDEHERAVRELFREA